MLEEARGWQPTGRGTPQGGVISPLLASLDRNPLDHQIARAGRAMVRQADDFVIRCRSAAEAQQALELVQTWVNEPGLALHPDKTRVVDARAPRGFDFLGYHCERGLRGPRKQSLGQWKDRLRAKTARLDGRSLSAIVADVKRSLRG